MALANMAVTKETTGSGVEILHNSDYTGAAITLDDLNMTVAFTDHNKTVLSEETFPIIP